jgi:hypothetical protein
MELATLEHLEENLDTWTDLVIGIVEGYYTNSPLNTSDLIDRIEIASMATFKMHLGSDTTAPIVRRLVSIARKTKRELEA